MEPINLDPQLRNRLVRFLHLGKEEPKYYPGCWRSHEYFKQTQLRAIDEALQNGTNNVEVVNIILKAHKEGWCTRFETIAFALTKCLLVGSAPIKEATYKAASEICITSEQLMTFNHFIWLMRSGNGQGWCKYIRDWYIKKDPMELAKELTRVKSRHGRSHKTLLLKSHMKIAENDHARGAAIKYALFGLKRAKQLVGNAEGTKEIFEYIQKVDDLRCCEDPLAAAAIVEKNEFTLAHVPGHLLTSQEVWDAVLPQLPLEDLLTNIHRIHNMGFLECDSTTTAIVVSMLTNLSLIKKSKLTPLAVYIALMNYEKKSIPIKSEKAKVMTEKVARRRTRQALDEETGQWEWTVTEKHPKEVKTWGVEQPPNQAVIAAMQKLYNNTWLLTPVTRARYLITMDMRNHMFKGRQFCKTFTVPRKGRRTSTKTSPGEGGGKTLLGEDGGKTSPGEGGGKTTSGERGGGDAPPPTHTPIKLSKRRVNAECFFNKNITPGHAAILIALQLLKREKYVKLAVFTDNGLEIVDITPKFANLDDTEFMLRKANLGRVQLDAPMVWARQHNKRFDVFINIVDRTSRLMELDLSDRGGRGPGGRYGPPPEPDSRLVDHCPARALQRYRNEFIRDAKLIVMSLASHRVATTDGSHGGILDIVGIDEHVPQVIDAFVLGQFD